MTSAFEIRPQIVAVSCQSGFLHLIQTVLDTSGFAVCITSDWRAAPELVERVQPKLVVLDLVPNHEAECWLALEALEARAPTQGIAVLLCPIADWLLEGHEARLAQNNAHVWPKGFNIDDLLHTVQIALGDHRIAEPSVPPQVGGILDSRAESRPRE
jgi:DNA-binding response OmpR family regulator